MRQAEQLIRHAVVQWNDSVDNSDEYGYDDNYNNHNLKMVWRGTSQFSAALS